jgi:hypothetical protein
MLVLDENLPAGQRLLLRKWRIRFRVIGVDLANRGTDDENLLPLRHQLSRPVFFTLDKDFCRPEWIHPRYRLAWLDVRDDQAAEFIRRFPKHPEFNTQVKRLGVVVKIQRTGVTYWRKKQSSPQSAVWPD